MIIPPKPGRAEDSISPDDLKARIGRNVFRALGSPGDVLSVKVHPMSNDHFRVNVLIGQSMATARIGRSYFLTSDGEGNILASTPEIVPQG